MKTKIRIALLVLATATVALISSCAGQYTVFASTDRTDFHPGSIAVVSGLGDDLSVSFAQQVTQDLQKMSNFDVATQRQITARFSAYPANIIDDPHAFSDADRAKFTQIAKGLGVNNILVVWIYNDESVSSGLLMTNLHFAVGGRLLSYPGGRITGTSEFGYNMSQGIRTQEAVTHEMIVHTAQILVKKLVDSTGTKNAG